MDIHLDPLGGWSGDMFVAAMLDAFPEHWSAIEAAVAALHLGPEARCDLVPHRDAALTGRRFLVAAESEPRAGHGGPHDDGDHHHHDRQGDGSHRHGPDDVQGSHRAWAQIREHIAGTDLDPKTREHAIGIFALLAAAEAEVHGVDTDAVMFHEVGAVDSIVDIVAAARIITAVDARTWTSAPLPTGSGRVRTAHGILPVPAPATALLLRGLPTIDDGIAGERVTPTGAAVARYLLAGSRSGFPRARRLQRTGTGFGQRRMPGISNCLRVLAFEPIDTDAGEKATGVFGHRDLAVIAFEVDDQSPEDLTAGLDHLRSLEGVHDVTQNAVFGKKGRLAVQVQVLVAPEHLDEAIAACFGETTTIGLRYHLVHGAALVRDFDEVDTAHGRLRVKSVHRPGAQTTAKTEASDVAAVRGHEARVQLRRAAEAATLSRPREGHDHDG